MTQTTAFDAKHISKKQQNSSADDAASMQRQDRIRQRAYELYEKRGGRDGHHEQDWLQAEKDVTGQYGLRNAA